MFIIIIIIVDHLDQLLCLVTGTSEEDHAFSLSPKVLMMMMMVLVRRRRRMLAVIEMMVLLVMESACTFSLWPKGWAVRLEGLDTVSIASYWTFSCDHVQ